ncbi:matrilin-2-like, partial [Narcine bancroftii]|uniref:matrilin-2-like n=1 Tax=Narcine bancroftii TaxID=1343680 RepID=UPI003831B3C8
NCRSKATDLVFIIDSSRSIIPLDFEKVKDFVINILRFLDVGFYKTRVGLILYGSTVKKVFSLSTHRNLADMTQAVRDMEHLATGTMTGMALEYTANVAFSVQEGARPLNQNIPRLAIVVTDGRPQDRVAKPAAHARDSGILIFAVGVGRVDMGTLRLIASEPHDKHTFLVQNFSMIQTLLSEFQTKICDTDLCGVTGHGCEQICINTPGSFICKCKDGFILNNDQKTCRKIDHCNLGEHGCEHDCVNTGTSYVCRCRSGFTLNPDGKTCRQMLEKLSQSRSVHRRVGTSSKAPAISCAFFGRSAPRDGMVGALALPVLARKDPTSPELVKFLQWVGSWGLCERLQLGHRELGRAGSLDKSPRSGCRELRWVGSWGEGYVLSPLLFTLLTHDCITRSSSNHTIKFADDTGLVSHNDKLHNRKEVENFVKWYERNNLRTDFCLEARHICEHNCVSTVDSYLCTCRKGYIINADGRTCQKCTNRAMDLVFFIDGSRRLGARNFQSVKKFVNNIVDSLEVARNATRVGLVQYAAEVQTEFPLGRYSTADEIKVAVSRIKYAAPRAKPGQDLRQLFKHSFKVAGGARAPSRRIPKMAVVFTSGRGQGNMAEWAAQARRNGINIYAVGFGRASEEELRQITSFPQDEYLYHAKNSRSMGEVAEKLKAQICKGMPSAGDHCKCRAVMAFQIQANEEIQRLAWNYIL